MNKPYASLSLDLDNLWAYKQAHGDKDWNQYPSYLDIAIPRILNILDELDLKVTFFVVGQDAALEKNHHALKSIVAAGHEIANHSFSHDPWFTSYPPAKVLEEIELAEWHIEQVTGIKPVGWRGPGFASSHYVLEQLVARGYIYDTSSLPTFLGPIARLYYFLSAGFSKLQRQQRKGLYGDWKNGFKPQRPDYITLNSNQHILEVPVTVMPLVRTPTHASYLQYLAKYSFIISRLYFGTALRLCSITNIPFSFLLHPTDFLGIDDIPELAWFPAMDQKSNVKIEQIVTYLNMLKCQYQVLPMQEFIKTL